MIIHNKIKSRLFLLFLITMLICVPIIHNKHRTSHISRKLEKFFSDKLNIASEIPSDNPSPVLINSSFESWHVINNLPEGWSYAQTGTGGAVYKEDNPKNIKFGLFSARVVRSTTGVSQLYYTLSDDNAKRLGGKIILFGCWVKSANRIPEKIAISVTTLDYKIPPEIYYKNTGEWEFIYFWYDVPKNENAFNLYLNVYNDDAYFDGAILATKDELLEYLGLDSKQQKI